MCCNFWEKCKNSPKTGLGCSTPLTVWLPGKLSSLNLPLHYYSRYLASNKLKHLPSNGLRNLLILDTSGNKQLEQIPSPTVLENIMIIVTEHPYHCCEYIKTPEEMPKEYMQINGLELYPGPNSSSFSPMSTVSSIYSTNFSMSSLGSYQVSPSFKYYDYGSYSDYSWSEYGSVVHDWSLKKTSCIPEPGMCI